MHGSTRGRSICLCNTWQIGVKAVLNYTQRKARAEHSKKGTLRSEEIKYMNIYEHLSPGEYGLYVLMYDVLYVEAPCDNYLRVPCGEP